MKVHGFAHFSLPFRCAGSEVVIHELLKAAVEAGHEATMWCTHRDAIHSWTGREPDIRLDGVTIKRVRNALLGTRLMSRYRPDVVVSHHQHVLQAIKTARLIKARSVFLLHNDMDLNRRPLQAKPDLTIFNSEWVRKSLRRFGEPIESLVFHPPLTPERHEVDTTGEATTLINLNEHKGAHVFYALAERMPERPFLGVVGGHGQQVIRHTLPNVTILEHGPDMKRVWSQTRVLLMPSVYESYGLVAVEAGVNGIPTIANPTPGLRENLGAFGLYARRDHIGEWIQQLHHLDGPLEYADASENATMLADDARNATQVVLKEWVEWLG